MKQIKQIQTMEEGYLKVTLTSKKDFDPYMLTLMERDSHTLPCQPKQRSSTIFFYDICEQLSLEGFLALYDFTEREACEFLYRLFQCLCEVSQELPVYASLTTIFYKPSTQSFSFLVLPLHEHSYENDWNALVKEIISFLHLSWETGLYGVLSHLTMEELLGPQDVLNQLTLWRQHHTIQAQIKYISDQIKQRREHRNRNEQRIEEALTRLRLKHKGERQSQKAEVIVPTSSDTVVLFPKEHKQVCLRAGSGHCYSLKDQMMIGRSSQCDIMLEDPTISAQHAKLVESATGWMLTDLASSNGTKLNGKRIQPYEAVQLQEQDVIGIATETLTLEWEETK